MHKAKLNIQLFASGTITASSTTMPSGTGKVDWSSSVVGGKNQSTVTAICYCRRTSGTGNYCTVSGSIGIGSQSKSISKYRGSDDKWNTTWKEVGRFTTTVNHDTNGTKSIKISFTISADTGGLNGTAKGDGTVQLDTINRASKLNAIANFNISDTITISIDKYVTDAVDTLQVKLGDTVIKEVANITDGYQLSFTDAEKTTIINLISAPQATLLFLLTTMNGDTVLGNSTQTAVATLSSGYYFREIYKKENGKYQVAINGFVNTEINDVLQVYDDNGNEILNENVLYNNESGSNGTIALSETAKNFKYIEIIFRDNDDTYSSVRVHNPNGKNVDLTTLARWSSTFYIKQKRVAISGTSITSGNATEVQLTTAPKIKINTSANNIYITRVVGYR